PVSQPVVTSGKKNNELPATQNTTNVKNPKCRSSQIQADVAAVKKTIAAAARQVPLPKTPNEEKLSRKAVSRSASHTLPISKRRRTTMRTIANAKAKPICAKTSTDVMLGVTLLRPE